MRDSISVKIITGLHPAIREKVRLAIEDAEQRLGARACVRIAQGLRTVEYQNHLYAVGRTEVGANARPGKPYGDIVTRARGGSSYHNYGLAVDCCILYDKDGNGTYEAVSWDLQADRDGDGQKDWQEMVAAFKAQGAEWGGDWKSIVDSPHFQWRFGHAQNCSDLFLKWEKKDFIPGTQYVTL